MKMVWWPRSRRRHPKPAPELPPMLELLEVGSEQRIAEVAEGIRRQKGKGSFFEMISDVYQSHIRRMSMTAYPSKGGGREFEEFQEDMSWNWLIKQAMFDEIGKAGGLETPQMVEGNADTLIIALTGSGSIIDFSRPKKNMVRDVCYWKVGEMIDTGAWPSRGACIDGDVMIGKRCVVVDYLDTSPVASILANPKAPDSLNFLEIRKRIKQVFERVDKHTGV